MPQLDHSKVFKVETLTVSDFATTYGKKVTPNAIYYAMDNGLVDYIVMGDRRYVVMTKLTKQYKPNSSPSRVKTKKKAKK